MVDCWLERWLFMVFPDVPDVVVPVVCRGFWLLVDDCARP